MSTIQAVVVDPQAPGRLVIQEVSGPTPGGSEAVVRVHAFSLNRGETHRAMASAEAGFRPGWDLAGVVEQAASDGSGPKAGARVVGFVPAGAWAERVAVPTGALAELPDTVSFSQAATLPVAGLTALHALAKGGLALGKSVLITGATGGVGDYAIQLARLAGATVTAHVRRTDQADPVRAAGAHSVAIGDDLAQAAQGHGRFDLIIESVGGATLAAALGLLAAGGVCVSLGVSAGAEVTFNAAQFFLTGGASLYGFILFHEVGRFESSSVGLARLAALVAGDRLMPHISVEEPWTKIADVAQDLMDRRYHGKAVLTIDSGRK